MCSLSQHAFYVAFTDSCMALPYCPLFNQRLSLNVCMFTFMEQQLLLQANKTGRRQKAEWQASCKKISFFLSSLNNSLSDVTF